MLWKFSHNNCPEILVEAPDKTPEAEVIRIGLERIGLTESTHPCRAWPADRGETPETLAAKAEKQGSV